MEKLVDANVWLPIVDGNHAHHRAATAWWDNLGSGEAYWCRFTQSAILRLLCNSKVMAGDTHSPEEAWNVWERLAHDDRAAFLNAEPPVLAANWFANIQGRRASPNLWTDAYLGALAESCGLEMVTFDRGFRRFALSKLTLLSP